MASENVSGNVSEIVARLRAAKSVAILSHQRADPDALGSACGLAIMLALAGVSGVRFFPFESASPQYGFILKLAEQSGARITPWSAASAAEIEQSSDVIAIVDTCTYNQLEPAAEMLKKLRPRVVAVDHHLTRDDLGLIYADTSAAACAQILWSLIPAFAIKPSASLAQCLLAGLVADTGFFRFDSVTGQTLRAAAEMTDAGGRVAELFERLTQNEQPSKLALTARALAGVRWAANNKIAVMTLEQTDFIQSGALVAQTEGIVNWALDVGSVEVAALLTQMPDGKIRASLRSKHAVDVNAVARTFGGGGHAKAAGLRLDGPMDAARDRIIQALQVALPAP